jgi:hypothetical protein
MRVKDGYDVVVSNTFLETKECAPYFVIAQKYRVKIDIVTCLGNYQSIHGVPAEKIEQMRSRMQDEKLIKSILGIDLSMFFHDPYDAYNHF